MARPQTQTTRTYSTSQSQKTEANQAPMDAAMRERIARRAYEIYLSRNGDGGDQTQDWLQAERELRLGRS